MYCVIQEIELKTVPKGTAKEIESYEIYHSYGYKYSVERYERKIKKAYRISIHKSFRKNGKICKKQYVICTISYYEIVDWGSWVGDYVSGWEKKVETIGLPEEELVKLIYQKFQPIIDQIEAEFQQTDEWKAKQEQNRIIKDHNKRIEAFTKKYEVERSEYNNCYDVFGTLRNADYLKKIKEEYQTRKAYEETSRRYQEEYFSNYKSKYHNSKASGYETISGSTYKAEEQEILKKFYRALSKQFHPDSNQGTDTSKEMQLLNQLKDEWNV